MQNFIVVLNERFEEIPTVEILAKEQTKQNKIRVQEHKHHIEEQMYKEKLHIDYHKKKQTVLRNHIVRQEAKCARLLVQMDLKKKKKKE